MDEITSPRYTGRFIIEELTDMPQVWLNIKPIIYISDSHTTCAMRIPLGSQRLSGIPRRLLVHDCPWIDKNHICTGVCIARGQGIRLPTERLVVQSPPVPVDRYCFGEQLNGA